MIRTKQITTLCTWRRPEKRRQNQPQTNLYCFVVPKGAKNVLELISTTIVLQSAPADLICSQKTQLEILQGMLTQDCIQECNIFIL